MELPKGCEGVVVAACDLDKTLYPVHGPHHAQQLRANIKAMFAFEAQGGFVFPVTGNNLLLAQRKFQDPDDEEKLLRDVGANPGIFTNGGLVLGPHGKEIEKHALGNLYVKDHPQGLDFVSALLDFYDSEAMSSLWTNVGIFCLTPDGALIYDQAPSNGDGYAASHRVTGKRVSRQEIIARRGEVLLLLFLFPAIVATEGRSEAEEYQATTFPWQSKVADALKERGLSNCSYKDGEVGGVGGGIKLTLMKDPWPEIDINVAGVDKGKALSRFLQNEDVLKYLGKEMIDPATQVAVFGDAPNDVPMFRSVGDAQPGLRVGMPCAVDTELLSLANLRSEVSDVLNRLCEAKQNAGAGAEAADQGSTCAVL